MKRNLKLTSPELARQIDRLEAAHLIAKRKSGGYAISRFGMTVRSVTTSLDFVAQHSDYFRNHDPSSIPDFLLRQLDPQMSVEIIAEKFGPLSLVMERGEAIREFYWIISDSIPKFVLPQVKMKIKQGVKFRALYPREYLDRVKPTLGEEIVRGVEFRVVDEVKIVVCVTDQFGYVCLPRSSDKGIDRSCFMFSSNPKYRTWCGQLFDYYWSKSNLG